MELRQLITFIQVAQLQSFSKAAENLGYSQSAVTVQIKMLEEELNARLFDRMGRRITLTDQGRKFLTGAYNTIREANRAKLSVDADDALAGELVIGAIDSLCSSALPSILSRFRIYHPGVTVRIDIGSPGDLLKKMEQGELDVIYILDEPRYNNHWYKLMEKREEIVFVTSNDLRGELGDHSFKVEDLLDLPFFLTEKQANYHRALDRYLATRSRELIPAVEIGDVSFLIKMLENSRGISFLPWFAVADSVRQGKLTVVNVTDFQVSMYRQIFYHKAKWRTREMDEFVRFALEDVGGDPTPLIKTPGSQVWSPDKHV